MRFLSLFSALLAGALLLQTGLVSAQPVSKVGFTQITRPVAEVTTPDLIELLLFELFIEPAEQPDRLEVIDITRNGYGPDDVLVVYPSMETFMIPELLPEAVQQIMSGWFPETEFQFDAGNLPAEALSLLVSDTTDVARRAERAIMSDVLRALEQHYRGLPISLRLDRDDVGFTFQIWDYDEAAMQYTPPPPNQPDLGAVDSMMVALYEMLQEVRYLPEGADLGQAAALRATANRALTGLAAVDDEQKRQLAAKTVLLGSFDRDRSGAIDQADEIDALSCDTWHALDTAFPNLLQDYGFLDNPDALEHFYYGNLVFNISERVKGPAARRADACLSGHTPPPTRPDEIAPAPTRFRMSERLQDFLDTEVAAHLVRTVWTQEPGSAAWAQIVREVLLSNYDMEGSGLLDQEAEVAAVPCVVWEAVRGTYGEVLEGLGFEGSRRYGGDRIGIALTQRQTAYKKFTTCAGRSSSSSTSIAPPTVAHMPDTTPDPQTQEALRATANHALTGLAAVDDEQKRQLAAKTVLLGSFDRDRSGAIDQADEIDALSCDTWHALDTAFPNLLQDYGFLDNPDALEHFYYGNLVFNISERVKGPAARRADACLSGHTPPPTRPDEIAPAPTRFRMSERLQDFLDTEVAAHLVRTVWTQEPGSAAWAQIVREVLLSNYDMEGSGLLDQEAEVAAVPCVVWEAVRGTYGEVLEGLGFEGSRRYGGDRIGVAPAQRERVQKQIIACQ